MVPIVQAALDRDFRSVPASTWTGCLLALAGVVVMGADPSAWTTAASPPSLLSSIPAAFTRGDALIVAAAFLYTLHVVRLGYWAKRTSPLRLATAKSTVQTTFSLCFVALLWHYGAGAAASGSAAAQAADPVSAASHGLASFALSAGREIAAFFGTFASKVSSGQISPPSLLRLAGTVLWCGTAGNAYALYAQSAGQRTVAPSDANLVYSLQPVFTALFAYLLLGETMDAAGLAGGALVLAAVYLVAAEALLSGSRGKAPESGTH
jgi:drug/metabolite transporter (DMT)-like permease